MAPRLRCVCSVLCWTEDQFFACLDIVAIYCQALVLSGFREVGRHNRSVMSVYDRDRLMSASHLQSEPSARCHSSASSAQSTILEPSPKPHSVLSRPLGGTSR
ncbi:hypothetical protein RvY_00205 [Ramazzottius varieornatus]|uniref:Uncharacterized protein n=1 Tax=Ramazzottius varieornatus TaxID=947166 RepID=A0A1D1UBY7_RAMVA|nr:hypothetical protein RvY_00205 [Ramazzottius varieornatus]